MIIYNVLGTYVGMYRNGLYYATGKTRFEVIKKILTYVQLDNHS